MYNDKHLHFIAEKIEELKDAIFYCHSNSPLKINNTIIQTFKADDTGCISFFINRPPQLISQFDREFPVKLNYFKKGKDFFINVFGKARIINDPEELAYETDLTSEEINNALTTHVFIKVNILKADFFDRKYEKRNAVIKTFMSGLSYVFDSFRSSKSYDFSSGGSIHNYGF